RPTRRRPSPPPSTSWAEAAGWRSSRRSPATPHLVLVTIDGDIRRESSPERRGSGPREQADGLFGSGQGGAGDLLGLLGTELEQTLGLAGVLGQLGVALADRP